MKKLLLIDGNAIFHRAFHALPLFQNSKGEYTNAIYGFLKMLFDVIQNEQPDYLATTFDHKDETFRHKEFSEYKANRAAPPEELYPQMPRLFDILHAMDIPVFQAPGFEADDIIGTLSKQAEADSQLQTLILTGDKDTFQLVSDQTFVITPQKGMSQSTKYDAQGVIQKMGIRPDQVIDYKALRGDSSDNIPGVKGIGEKQAIELLQKYDNLKKIYENLDQLTVSQKKKLETEKEMAYLSQKMATILRDMPIKLDLEKCCFLRHPSEKAHQLMEDLEFKSLTGHMQKYLKYVDQKIQAETQSSLF
ncbi:hypothetical protein GF376_02165 [Candidatus Peregrinibacteria bacterium]|nr:hypothetical protein [Candidatus Peregrinibacteria bacterium]